MTYQDGIHLLALLCVMFGALCALFAALALRLQECEMLMSRIVELIHLLVSTLFGRGSKK